LCNGTKVTCKDLSSGERLIVSILARKNINFKAEIVLLDEPDKHLDPKLCKLFMKVIRDVLLKIGIQVIMKTHRMDMVALSADGELFVIEIKGHDSIARIRLLAMAKSSRYTRYTREFMGFQVKIYTESISTDYLLQRKKKKIILPLKEDYFHFDGGLNS
jgi:energy-coupling factor transporter ATP-binding protein EcfA2